MSDDVCEQVRIRMRASGFPGSLLPSCTVDGAIDDSSGRFRVTLAREVIVHVDGFPVRYAKTISGIVAMGSLTEMSGVHVKKILWLRVRSIHAEPEHLKFKVAGVAKRIPRTAWDD